MTPALVHRGEMEAVTQASNALLSGAFKAHPEYVVRGTPWAQILPEAAWISKPKTDARGSETWALAEDAPNRGVERNLGQREIVDPRASQSLISQTRSPK
jgi:hypothetical protein